MSFNPGIAIGGTDNFKGNIFDVFLDFRVIILPARETLGGIEYVVWVGDSLSLGWHANKLLTICCKGHN